MFLLGRMLGQIVDLGRSKLLLLFFLGGDLVAKPKKECLRGRPEVGAADSAADQPEYPLCKLEASDPLVRYLDIWALAELRLGQPGLIPQPAVELHLKQLEIPRPLSHLLLAVAWRR